MKLLAIGLVLIGTSAFAAEVIRGEAMVRDAVTLAIAGGRIRLEGISVPDDRNCGERACAEAAAAMMAALVERNPVACAPSRRLGHGFTLGRCRLVDGSDLGRRLLTEGLADLGEGADAADEAAVKRARAAKIGMWRE